MSNHMLTPFKMHQQDKLLIKTWGRKRKIDSDNAQQ